MAFLDANYELENSLGYLTRTSTKRIGNRLLRKFKEAGYTTSIDQWVALAYLWHYRSQNQQQLVEAIQRDKTAVTRLIDQMEKEELALRIPAQDDRRQNLIHLTKKGQQLYQVLAMLAQETLNEAVQGVSREDITACMRTLRKINENLQ